MRRIGSFAGAALGLLAVAPAAAQDYKAQIDLRMVKVTQRDGKGAILVDVLNGAKVRLDVEVTCSFFLKDDVVGRGTGQVTVVASKSEPLEVRAPRPFKFEKASCTVDDAKP
jgi:hypothetical protein